MVQPLSAYDFRRIVLQEEADLRAAALKVAENHFGCLWQDWSERGASPKVIYADRMNMILHCFKYTCLAASVLLDDEEKRLQDILPVRATRINVLAQEAYHQMGFGKLEPAVLGTR